MIASIHVSELKETSGNQEFPLDPKEETCVILGTDVYHDHEQNIHSDTVFLHGTREELLAFGVLIQKIVSEAK